MIEEIPQTMTWRWLTHYTEEELQHYREIFTLPEWNKIENEELLGFVNFEKQWFIGFTKEEDSRMEINMPLKNAINLGVIEPSFYGTSLEVTGPVKFVGDEND